MLCIRATFQRVYALLPALKDSADGQRTWPTGGPLLPFSRISTLNSYLGTICAPYNLRYNDASSQILFQVPLHLIQSQPSLQFGRMNISSIPASACAASAIAYPTAFGTKILNLSANLVQNYSEEVSDQWYYNHPSVSVKNIDYCNVTVTYTHPGQNDTINVETWLPMNNWNGRLQAVGGGGYVTGRFYLSYVAMAGAIGNGYVATTTDAGIGTEPIPDSWALNSPGNVDMYALQNAGYVSLKDQVRTNRL